MVEMHLSAVRVEYPTNTPILLLQEATGDRALPIYIGRPEAEAIATALQGVVTKRPMTHDLMRDVLTEVGLVLDHVVITELKDQTFYAELRLRRGAATTSSPPGRRTPLPWPSGPVPRSTPKRPCSTPKASSSPSASDLDEPGEGEELVAQFHEFIEGVRPEDFDK